MKVDYAAYLESEAWKARRQWKLNAAENRCQLCNSEYLLNVHHRTYDRLGNEREADLVVLCEKCHKHYHNIVPKPPAAEPEPVSLAAIEAKRQLLKRNLEDERGKMPA